MTKPLRELIQTYLAEQDDDVKHEEFDTARGFSEQELRWFVEWLEDRGEIEKESEVLNV